MRRIAIVGFGLIGGSLALALRRQSGIHVTAIDRAPVLALAEAKHAADELLPLEEAAAMQSALESADITVLAVPVGTIVRLLPWSLSHARVVTDCGSTKREIAQAAAEHQRVASFVPGHPMAGLPDGGIEEVRSHLQVAVGIEGASDFRADMVQREDDAAPARGTHHAGMRHHAGGFQPAGDRRTLDAAAQGLPETGTHISAF